MTKFIDPVSIWSWKNTNKNIDRRRLMILSVEISNWSTFFSNSKWCLSEFIWTCLSNWPRQTSNCWSLYTLHCGFTNAVSTIYPLAPQILILCSAIETFFWADVSWSAQLSTLYSNMAPFCSWAFPLIPGNGLGITECGLLGANLWPLN